MKKKYFAYLFIILSAVWLIAFLILFLNSQKIQDQIDFIKENRRELVNLPFYKREVEKLQSELKNIEWDAFSSRPVSEFAALLPKLAEKKQIETLRIENNGTRMENGREVSELQISIVSSFSKIAGFIDLLEQSRLPIQIVNLNLEENNGQIRTLLSIRIYKPLDLKPAVDSKTNNQ